jgi:hypothetical protein
MRKSIWTSRVKVSDATRARVFARIEANKAAIKAYKPDRRPFTPTHRKVLNVARTLCRVPIWKML